MFELATVNEWYELSVRHPEFRGVTVTNLKNWGVMKAASFIEERFASRHNDKGIRILEFGHGFNHWLLSRYQNRYEVWGADRPQGLHYFKDDEWDQRFAAEMVPACPSVKFARTLVGENIAGHELPENYFDIIVSISVLEEMPVAAAGAIVNNAAKLLRPGGVLLSSYDLLLANFTRLTAEYYHEHRRSGLIIDPPPDGVLDWSGTLIENPLAVMLWYQGGMPEKGRKFWGHHGSIFTAGQKPTEG
ncbi:class I SAM-dependent methyltransferase [Methylobacterium brachiatum]|uniref:class I SAM-dependent methyltransferase n=1 Tax=Methylobacterium brachiatum TaxID=269660 RepID=UPI001113A6F6|nr:class I SAM-dependent methyltransferase [Methylobacterium brachiatum]